MMMKNRKASTAFFEKKAAKKLLFILHRAGETCRGPESQKFFGSSRSDEGASKTLLLNRPRGEVQKRTASSCCSTH
jgi:hypothetical protein